MRRWQLRHCKTSAWNVRFSSLAHARDGPRFGSSSGISHAASAIRWRASACEYLIELTDANSTQYDPKQVNATFVDGTGKVMNLPKDP
jgi:hypothetical protein